MALSRRENGHFTVPDKPLTCENLKKCLWAHVGSANRQSQIEQIRVCRYVRYAEIEIWEID